MTTHGYLRVSTRVQAENNGCEMQRAAILRWGAVDQWHEDLGLSGKFMDRPAWDTMNAKLQRGDTVVAYDLSRCARNLLGLLEWVRGAKDKGVRIVFVKENIDVGTAMGDLLLGILGAFAQWQAELNSAKAREGMAEGKRRGAKYGRKFSLTPEQAAELRALANTGHRGWKGEAARRLGLHPNTIGNYLKRPTMPPVASVPLPTSAPSLC